MKKLTVEEIIKNIEEIEAIYLEDLFLAIWERCIKENTYPCDFCTELTGRSL